MKRWLLTPLVASLFLVSFYESWWALNEAAVAAEIPDPRPWPWAVDGFILVMALMVVFAAIDGHSWGTWWPRLGLLGATALSTGIQAAWAPQADWAWALHAWSPLAVLCSFECLVWLVFAQGPARPRPVQASGPPLPARAHAWLRSWDDIDVARPDVARGTGREAAAGATGAPRGREDPARPRATTQRASEQDRATVATWVGEGRSQRWMADQLGWTGGAGRQRLARLIRELAAAPVGGPGPNGDGGGS